MDGKTLDEHKRKILFRASQLALMRSAQVAWQKEVELHREDLEALDEWTQYQKVIELEAFCREDIQEDDRLLRELLVEAFETTGVKKFGDGLTVKEMTGVKLIDHEKVLEWAFKEARHLITLDKRGLATIAKRQEIPGVELFKTPKASIARDLSQYIENKEDENDSR